MSAVMSESTIPAAASLPQHAELRFRATRAMARQLWIEFRHGYLYVQMCAPGGRFLSLAYGSARLEKCSLHPRGTVSGNPCLFVGSEVLFRLTDAEAAEVERVFAPIGLSVVREKLQS